MFLSDGKNIFLNANKKRTFQIRGHLWKTNKRKLNGRILILPGFTEPCEKYYEISSRLTKIGYDCLIIDWPGQGLSGHLGNKKTVIHCKNFNQHLSSLRELISKTDFKDNYFSILGHSMGGHIALNCSKNTDYKICKLILVAPMFVPKGPPVFLVIIISYILIKFGFGKKTIPFTKSQSLEKRRIFKKNNPLTRCKIGYDVQFKIFKKYPDLMRFEPSVGWVYSAFLSCFQTTLNHKWLKSIKIPILFLLAGDENVVDSIKTEKMIENIDNKIVYVFKNAKHDLKNETSDVKIKMFKLIEKFIKKDEINT